MIKRVIRLIPSSFRKRGLIVTSFVPLRALLDLAGVAVLLPMLILVLDSKALEKSAFLGKIYDYLGFTEYRHFIIFLVIAVLGVILLKSFINIFLVNYQNKYLLSLYRFFSRSLFSRLYNKGLLYVKNSNSAKITFNINSVCYSFGVSYLASILRFVGESLFCLFLLIALCFYNPLTALFIVCSFLPIVFIYLRIIRSRLKKYGQKEMEARREQQKVVQETFKGYAEMAINNAFPQMLRKFDNGLQEISKYRIKSSLIQSIPSYLLEIAVSIVVAILVIFSLSASDASIRIFLGVFTVAIIRMLPAVHGLIGTWSAIKATQYTVEIVSEIEDGIQNNKPSTPSTKEQFKFEETIKVENLSFAYEDKNIINNLSFEIRKGERFGIKGRTGAGKSTLFNLLLGLIPSKEGTISIDGKPLNEELLPLWHSIVGYVPQDVFVADLSIAENIALGEDLENIDRDRVHEVLRQVSMEEFINSLPNGIDTIPGEAGSRISGGQRQRIGIARALYKQAEVLFFDEATSSLDVTTEKEINDAIRNLSDNYRRITIIIISHRLSSLEFCDRILDIDE